MINAKKLEISWIMKYHILKTRLASESGFVDCVIWAFNKLIKTIIKAKTPIVTRMDVVILATGYFLNNVSTKEKMIETKPDNNTKIRYSK